MKVFISWSGARSQLLAEALRHWIHDVIQTVDCFSSTDDIRSGQRWNNEINLELANTDFGILCVTPENMKNPWLNFEAGALAKRIEQDSRVVPVTLGFSPSALEEPLKQFNGVAASRSGITTLMKDLAAAASVDIDMDRAVDRWWTDLEAAIAAIPDADNPVDAPQPPDVGEMFTDLMASIKGLSKEMQSRYPRRGSESSRTEASTMARILANDDALREDVSLGNPGAIRHLQRRTKAEVFITENSSTTLAEMRRGAEQRAATPILDDQGDSISARDVGMDE